MGSRGCDGVRGGWVLLRRFCGRACALHGPWARLDAWAPSLVCGGFAGRSFLLETYLECTSSCAGERILRRNDAEAAAQAEDQAPTARHHKGATASHCLARTHSLTPRCTCTLVHPPRW